MLPLLALLLAAAQPAPTRVVVLDVKVGDGVAQALGPYLTQVLAGRVAERSGTRPLVTEDVRALLGFEQTRQKLGCESDQCLAEIAGALGAGLVVNASVAASGSRYLVTASLLDSRRAEPVARAAEMADHDDAALVRAVEQAADRLFAAVVLTPQGTVQLQAAPAPGRAPAVPPQAVAPERPGFGRRGYAWVAGGTAVALAGAGAVVGASALSKANAGDTSARGRAHTADALYAGSVVVAGLALWLWLGGEEGK